jgi:hypothetical protein
MTNNMYIAAYELIKTTYTAWLFLLTALFNRQLSAHFLFLQPNPEHHAHEQHEHEEDLPEVGWSQPCNIM